jgi:tRNA(Ile)-lysidine synthase
MFMLDFFHRQCGRPFAAAHYDHGLRDASAEERDLVARFCAERGIAFHSGRGDPDAMRAAPSLEAEARRQRYGFLEGLLRPGEVICTGHHANDQLETVLLRLMRGYPDDALRMRRFAGNRFKPFLSVPKEEIVRQAANRRIPWMEDESNQSLDMERNWVRNSLVPQMMERRNVLKTIGMKQPPEASDTLLTTPSGRAK